MCAKGLETRPRRTHAEKRHACAEQRHTRLERWERAREETLRGVKEGRCEETPTRYTHAARCEGAASTHTLRDVKQLRVHTRCEYTHAASTHTLRVHTRCEM